MQKSNGNGASVDVFDGLFTGEGRTRWDEVVENLRLHIRETNDLRAWDQHLDALDALAIRRRDTIESHRPPYLFTRRWERGIPWEGQ